MDSSLRRWAPLSGVVFVVLYVTSTIIGLSGSPDFAGDPQEITEFYVDEKDSILVSVMLGALSVPFFLFFAGCLRSAIARVEGGTTRLASTAFGGAVAALTAGISGAMINAMGALRVDEQGDIPVDVATAYFDIAQILEFAALPALLAGSLAAVAVASLRYGAILPRWFAYLTLVLAVIDVIPPISWIGTMLGILWVLAVSILLYRQGVDDGQAPTPVAPVGAQP